MLSDPFSGRASVHRYHFVTERGLSFLTGRLIRNGLLFKGQQLQLSFYSTRQRKAVKVLQTLCKTTVQLTFDGVACQV